MNNSSFHHRIQNAEDKILIIFMFFISYKLWFFYGKHNHKIQFSELGLIFMLFQNTIIYRFQKF
jgi:hypothetical protein